jgi:hypothetical protein
LSATRGLNPKDYKATGLRLPSSSNCPGFRNAFLPDHNHSTQRDATWGDKQNVSNVAGTVVAEPTLTEAMFANNAIELVRQLPSSSDVYNILSATRRVSKDTICPPPSAVVASIPSRNKVQAAQMFIRLATRLNRRNDDAVQQRVDTLLWTLLNERDPLGPIRS